MYGDINKKVSDYETKIALLSQQLERINLILKSKVEENGQLDARLRGLTD